jgi:alkylation response protein AidB-like acyl-CoA dehydrogenase
MDLSFTGAEQQLRAEARAWLRAHVPADPLPSLDTAEGFERHRAWEHLLHDAGWAVVNWPARYGGRDATIVEWLVFEEEYYAADAPRRVGQNGIFLLAPTLFEFGTEEQRERFLPRMAHGDDIWAQAWSEPGAGSDLAALRSTARRVEGGWRLSGQKTWSTRAAYADWAFGLFRSDPDVPRHKGLTYFLFPLDAEGVTVRPIRQLDGEVGFAEIFCDDVFVPDSDVLGEPGQGWRIAMSTTGSERGLTLRSPGRYLATADRLVGLAGRLGAEADPTLQAAVAQCWIDAEAYRLFTLETVGRVLAGETLGAESSLNKLFWSQLDIDLHETALRLLGSGAPLAGAAPAATDGGRWLDDYLFALAGPIYAGTNEIQRNVVAERVLGLPKGG